MKLALPMKIIFKRVYRMSHVCKQQVNTFTKIIISKSQFSSKSLKVRQMPHSKPANHLIAFFSSAYYHSWPVLNERNNFRSYVITLL